jgi:hypothetical protein
VREAVFGRGFDLAGAGERGIIEWTEAFDQSGEFRG